ncbi:MAG: nucleotide sugar dehydrogenase, partial [Clostridia bacterium]|nr:nucleotide sugar dehydrogenase [Clostridia bacterium]
DINETVIKAIKKGSINIQELYKGVHIGKVAQDLIKNAKLSVYNNYNRQNSDPSVFIITVGIADQEDGSHDISPLSNLLDTILPSLVDEDLLIFRTTMIPGTCNNFIAPIIKSLNKKIYLAYSPETILETRAFEELENNVRILAGLDDESYNKAAIFLKSLSHSKIEKASDILTAEMVKVVQNITRDVDISLINELSEISSHLGVDIYELRKLVNTHPRIELLLPGPGVGGYCLPNALKYLEGALEKDTSLPLTLMQTARKLNEKRPQEIVKIVKDALKKEGKSLKKSKIAMVGLAMKDYCADCRYSPAIEIASQLIIEGAKIYAFDSLVSPPYPYQVKSFEECIKNADCLLITAKQFNMIFDVDEIIKLMKQPTIVVDTRNVFPIDTRILLYRT